MRTIDADEMVKRLEEWNTADPMDKALYNFAMSRINEQPTAQPEPQWIPCSERLPNDADYKECSAFSGGAVWYFTDKGEMGLGYCYTSIKEWETIDEWSPYGKVIAWMPLPEPYREEGENE